jgi:spore germination cell wall hydrolase CwlJ-like protein
VYQKDQFSFVTLTDLVPRDKQAWQQAQYWADKYLQNKLDYTGACHYHADYVEPYWSKTMKGYKAGTHIFYEGGC